MTFLMQMAFLPKRKEHLRGQDKAIGNLRDIFPHIGPLTLWLVAFELYVVWVKK